MVIIYQKLIHTHGSQDNKLYSLDFMHFILLSFEINWYNKFKSCSEIDSVERRCLREYVRPVFRYSINDESSEDEQWCVDA